MIYIKREQFIWEFQKTGKIPSCYKKIFFNNAEYLNPTATENPEKIIYVSLIPSYLKYTLVNNNAYFQKKITHRGKEGAGILIDGDYTIDSYLQKFTKRQLRVNIKRGMMRLEASFNIMYEYNFGNISKNKCKFLLSELKTMLSKRFKEKNMQNMFLIEWDLHTEGLESLINESKASLFVIYSNQKPISISLNTHVHNNILISHTNGYDINYSKYSLGHIDNYLLLNWCLEHNYHFLDLGIGTPEYKKKWCNTFYDFEYHWYYKKNSIAAKILMLKELNKVKTKNFIKQSKFIDSLIKFKNKFKKPTIINNNMQYSLEEIKMFDYYKDTKNLKKINLNQLEVEHLKKPVYDYLYSNEGHIDTINLYSVNDDLKTYVIQSENQVIELIFN